MVNTLFGQSGVYPKFHPEYGLERVHQRPIPYKLFFSITAIFAIIYTIFPICVEIYGQNLTAIKKSIIYRPEKAPDCDWFGFDQTDWATDCTASWLQAWNSLELSTMDFSVICWKSSSQG